MDLHQRERKVDISKLSLEDADSLSLQIGDKVRNICDEAANKINSILKIYGMSAKIAIEFNGLNKEEAQELASKKKRSKKTKQDNLK